MFAKHDAKAVSEVFGVSNEILPDSYVDRGQLDEEVAKLLSRPTHVALRGESKCGKSWLRQRITPNAILVQCRLGKTCEDIYADALSELGIRLEVQRTASHALKGRVEAEAGIGLNLIAKVKARFGFEASEASESSTKAIGQDFTDLKFVAELIKESGRPLVIDDFHYLSIVERTRLAFDLKAMWDFGLFVVIIGVWSKQNMLLYLNPDLTGRVEEVAVSWSSDDLNEVFEKGAGALRLKFGRELQELAAHDCFENVGILQRLILGTLDAAGVEYAQDEVVEVSDTKYLEEASMAYAEQLNPLYQQFAERVSKGIRSRSDSTGIYAHAMAAILDQSDEDLIRGVKLDTVFDQAHAREPRIQKGNLRIVLEKFEQLQVDQDGRGLVLGYNESTREVSAVDRQLLLYRKYSTVKWPWEDMIDESDTDDFQVDASN